MCISIPLFPNFYSLFSFLHSFSIIRSAENSKKVTFIPPTITLSSIFNPKTIVVPYLSSNSNSFPIWRINPCPHIPHPSFTLILTCCPINWLPGCLIT